MESVTKLPFILFFVLFYGIGDYLIGKTPFIESIGNSFLLYLGVTLFTFIAEYICESHCNRANEAAISKAVAAGDRDNAVWIRDWAKRCDSACNVVGTVYVIRRCNPGQNWTDCTFDVSSSRAIKHPSCDAYASETAALEDLAAYVTDRFYDWITLDDEDGAEKTNDRIMAGYGFEDGDGVRYAVFEVEFEQHFDCGPDGTNNHSDFTVA